MRGIYKEGLKSVKKVKKKKKWRGLEKWGHIYPHIYTSAPPHTVQENQNFVVISSS